MNDSNNNNIFGNNVTPQPLQPQNNNVNGNNPTPNVNSIFGINTTNTTNVQNERSPLNQNVETIQPLQPQNNINTQMNNTISNINPTPVNPLPNNNVNVQTTMQSNQSINNIPPQQNVTTFNQINDEDLLKSFIGNNYEKITTRPFNFAAFLFTTFYMFYRKMFGYALLVFLINIVLANMFNNSVVTFVVTIVFGICVGLLANKIYLSYAKRKIAKIRANNSQASPEELKRICATKGGTSVGKIFLGLITEIGITFVVLIVMMIVGIDSAIGEFFNLDNWNTTVNENDTNNSSSTTNGTLVEDVIVIGYSCEKSKCYIYILESNNTQELNNTTGYVLNANNSELIKILNDYSDYIKVNIYYTQKGEEKTIVDYKVFLKSNNEDISNIKTENELRDKIGLYSIGTHTDWFTLSKIDTGFGIKGDTLYNYTICTFVDSKNIEYEMKYINSNDTLNLVEGNKYNVTFEVAKDTFEYKFTIKSVK